MYLTTNGDKMNNQSLSINFNLVEHINNQKSGVNQETIITANDNNKFTKRISGVFDGLYCDIIYNIEPWEVTR